MRSSREHCANICELGAWFRRRMLISNWYAVVRNPGAQIDGSYRPALRAYERALRTRNALLKSPMLRAREVAAYDAPLIEHGRVLLRLRAELTEMLAPLATQAYRRISA